MKKILTGMAALSAIAVAAPAAAQQGHAYGHNRYGNAAAVDGNLSVRLGQLQARIDSGVRSGAISRGEAISLQQQLRQLALLERRYAANGISGQERADLQHRIRSVRQQVRAAEGDAQRRWEDEGDYRQGQYGQRYEDRNRNGRDDRYETGGRGYDDRYEDERYEDEYRQPARGGLGGVLGSVIGGGGGLGSVLGGGLGSVLGGLGGLGGLADILRVGQRATGGLYAVPSQYGSQFRDRSGVQYRTDGRQIYEIDARSQTVLQVYPVSR